jgi:hypothetical protein
MAAEIASIINDGANRRVIPVVAEGPLRNLTDLRYMPGIDLAIVQADALDYGRKRSPGAPASGILVAKLHDIGSATGSMRDTSVDQLAGKATSPAHPFLKAFAHRHRRACL